GPQFQGAAVAGLAYVHVSGAGEGGRWIDIRTGSEKSPGPSFGELAAEAYARLVDLVRRYRNPAQGYASRPRIAFERLTSRCPAEHRAHLD
ncbi:hypothetical protein J8J40_27685, partial [Mycobacterium tuberculosis]|nr:hypothetical protein [Mycobacterium tuberculosis]